MNKIQRRGIIDKVGLREQSEGWGGPSCPVIETHSYITGEGTVIYAQRLMVKDKEASCSVAPSECTVYPWQLTNNSKV